MTSKLETKGVRVFLGNIPFEAGENDMMSICELAGRVVEFRFVMDNKRGRHKGTGFCEYPDVDTAQAAIRNLNKYPLRGRELIVDWADNEMKSKTSLNKILNLDQFDQVGNRITGLMKRGEQEVLKVDPQDAGTLGECCQVLHQMSPAQLLYCISELQKLIHKNAAGAKEYLKDNPHLAWTMTHACFLVGITDNDVMMREENRDPKKTKQSSIEAGKNDAAHVFSEYEEDILRQRAKTLRETLFGPDFAPVKKDVISTQFLRKLERMTQVEVFEYLRNLKPDEIAALPTDLQLQAQAVRASQKDTIRTEEFNKADWVDPRSWDGGRGGGPQHQQHQHQH